MHPLQDHDVYKRRLDKDGKVIPDSVEKHEVCSTATVTLISVVHTWCAREGAYKEGCSTRTALAFCGTAVRRNSHQVTRVAYRGCHPSNDRNQPPGVLPFVLLCPVCA